MNSAIIRRILQIYPSVTISCFQTCRNSLDKIIWLQLCNHHSNKCLTWELRKIVETSEGFYGAQRRELLIHSVDTEEVINKIFTLMMDFSKCKQQRWGVQNFSWITKIIDEVVDVYVRQNPFKNVLFLHSD